MIDFGQLADLIVQGAVKGLGRGATIVEARAKARAPVRNIFGRGHSFRQKTVGEYGDLSRAPAKAIENALKGGTFSQTVDWEAYQTANTGRAKGLLTVNNKGKKRYQRDWKMRRKASVERLLADYEDDPSSSPLTRHGASEVRTKRAQYSTGGHLGIGGRLRGEIYSTSPRLTGDGAEVWVISPTEYAKYQEFGTRHNRAHPFLRPALMESREEVVAQIAEAVREASSRSLGNVNLEIVVRL